MGTDPPDKGFGSTLLLPGAQSSRLTAAGGHSFIAGSPESETHIPIVLGKGSGSYVWDVDDNRYLDFCNSLNLPFGHSPVETMQTSSLLNSGNYMTTHRLSLLQQLVELFPYLSGFQFRSSGTESVEAAIRYAKRCYPSDLTIVAVEGAYHGLTLAAQMAMGCVDKRSESVILPFPNGSDNDRAHTILKECVDRKPVLLVFETVQGATLRHLPESFFNFLAKLKSSRRDGLLLLCDDMLASVRCGNWCSATEWVTPDLLVAGKSWSGGYPFSFFGVTASVRETAGDILGTTTYGGNPVACEAAVRTIQRLKSEEIIASIRVKEAYIKAEYVPRWLELSGVSRAGCVGLLFGVTMQSVERATHAAVTLLKNGILCARIRDLLRFSPPLNVSQNTLAEALQVISKCLHEGQS
jgi:acetylornithine/N-succinyldiaminopimelate aminotransferase